MKNEASTKRDFSRPASGSKHRLGLGRQVRRIANAARPSIGKIHGAYFSDMHDVLHAQFKALEPGGTISCVVANSIFSRRMRHAGGLDEIWRLPVLTDVVIGRIAEAIGFEDVQIWIARTLQAKNVNGGSARESVVVARKPVRL